MRRRELDDMQVRDSEEIEPIDFPTMRTAKSIGVYESKWNANVMEKNLMEKERIEWIRADDLEGPMGQVAGATLTPLHMVPVAGSHEDAMW